MFLNEGTEGKEYKVVKINTNDDELESFLFSLGCYSGEKITIVSNKKSGSIIYIKDARYNIDNQLAKAIVIE